MAKAMPILSLPRRPRAAAFGQSRNFREADEPARMALFLHFVRPLGPGTTQQKNTLSAAATLLFPGGLQHPGLATMLARNIGRPGWHCSTKCLSVEMDGTINMPDTPVSVGEKGPTIV